MHDQCSTQSVQADGIIKLKGDLLQIYKDPTLENVPKIDPTTFSKIGSVRVIQEQAHLHTHVVFPTRLEITAPKNAGLSAEDQLTYITHINGIEYRRDEKTYYAYWIYAACPRQKCYYMFLAEFEVAKMKAR